MKFKKGCVGYWKGKKLSEKHKKNLSESNKGKKHSEETKRKISLANKGKTFSLERRRKIGLTSKGRKHSEETRKKISKANFGKKHTEETKIKMSEQRKGKKHSEETKRKIGLANSKALKGKYVKEKHWNWKGGEYTDIHGYVWIYVKKHPFKVKGNYIRKHRLVMEQKLCRYLKPEEVVHHINGIKTDNRLENLQLFKNQSEHMIDYYVK